MWSYFEVRDIIKNIDFMFDIGFVNLWWMHSSGNLEDGIKSFRYDKDVFDTSKFVKDNNVMLNYIWKPKQICQVYIIYRAKVK